MSAEIRVDEWLDELERLNQRTDDTSLRTVTDLVDAWGVAKSRVNRLLRAAKMSGRLLVGRVPRERLDGTVGMSPAYRVLRKAVKK